jgi:ArsR family transcriptional regulator, arsenate/arsenite/antimonite-responsive transcriptional repressor
VTVAADATAASCGLTQWPAARFDYHMVISVAGDASVGETLRLLADPTRAAIIEALAAGPACTCHLVDDLGLTQPNVSNHLGALRQAGLVVREPHGRFTYYRLLPEALAAAAAHLVGLADQARTNAETRRECP